MNGNSKPQQRCQKSKLTEEFLDPTGACKPIGLWAVVSCPDPQ